MTRPSFFAAAVLGILAIMGTPILTAADDELVTIEVTLPAGIGNTDEDIQEAIDQMLRPPTMSPTISPIAIPTLSPSSHPTMRNPSIKETKFRQEFEMRSNRELDDDELRMIEALYERYTTDFYPLARVDVDNKIVTTCTIERQILLDDETTTPSTLSLDYTMTYESIHYNVTEYPKFFQNWTTNNLDVVLQQMQFLNIDVTSVDFPKRIVFRTPSPTVSPFPSFLPTFAPTPTFPPTSIEPDIIATPAPTVSETVFGGSNIIMLAASTIVAFAILGSGLFVYCSRKRRANRHEQFNPGTLDTLATGMSRTECMSGNDSRV